MGVCYHRRVLFHQVCDATCQTQYLGLRESTSDARIFHGCFDWVLMDLWQANSLPGLDTLAPTRVSFHRNFPSTNFESKADICGCQQHGSREGISPKFAADTSGRGG